MRVHGHSSCALHLGIPSCWSGNVFNLAVEHGQKGQITQLLKLEMSVVKAFMVSLFFFFFLFLSYFSTWHCEIKFEMKVFMNVIVFQLLRFKTSLRSCWNYIPSFYVPSIFPRCFNVFWKVPLNWKNSRASKVERFVKWIFFLRIYIISSFYTCSNYARLIFIFSSTFWSAKWKNSENYFLNSKKKQNKTSKRTIYLNRNCCR